MRELIAFFFSIFSSPNCIVSEAYLPASTVIITSSISAPLQQASLTSVAPNLSDGRTSSNVHRMAGANPQRDSDSGIGAQSVQAHDGVQTSSPLEGGEPPHIHNNRASQILET